MNVFEPYTGEAKVEGKRGKFITGNACSTRKQYEVGGHEEQEKEDFVVVPTPRRYKSYNGKRVGNGKKEENQATDQNCFRWLS
jgi:hypothetical protein